MLLTISQIIPDHRAAKKLKGEEELYRIRIGDIV